MTEERNNLAKIIVNKSYKNDMENAIAYTRYQLQSIGIWPYACEVWNYQKIVRLILIIICCLTMIFLMIPVGIYIVLDEENFRERLALTGSLSFSLMSLGKYIILFLQEKNIKSCLDKMKVDFQYVNDSQDRMIMMENVKIGRFLTMICIATTHGTSVLYLFVVPNITETIVDDRNVTLRSLPCPSDYYFFDVQLTPAFEIIYFTQTLMAYVNCTIRSGTCSLAANFVTHVSGQCEIIATHINNLLDGHREEFHTIDDRLRDIVQQHSRLLRFVADVQYIFNKLCFVDLLGCTLNICLLGYDFIMAWEDHDALGSASYILLMVAFVCNIFIFCYISEFLAQKCEDIGKAAYTIDWYQLPAEKAVNLKMIMAISVRPMNLTAGKFIKLSHGSFTEVLKAAMTYLNVLRALTIHS